MTILLIPFIVLVSSIPTISSQADIPISELYKFTSVRHPNSIYKINDIENTKKKIKLYEWADKLNKSIVSSARKILTYYNDTFINNFVSRTTPSTTTFCPNCYVKGHWHPNGDWSWSYKRPDELTCNICGMKFPNPKYPETLRLRSTWDPEQEFSYINNGPVQCMSYKICRSSIEGVIRGKKLAYLASTITTLGKAYILSNNSDYALHVRKTLRRLGEVMPKYLLYAGYSYSEYCDMDPHEAVKDPTKCNKFIFAPGNLPKTGLYNTYWAASRLGTSGLDGTIVENLALGYDLTVDAVDKTGNPIYSKEDKEFISKNCLVESALLGFYDTSINNKAVFNRQGCTFVGLVTGSHLLTRFGLEGFLNTFDNYFLPDGGTSESASYSFMAVEGIYMLGLMLRDYSDPSDFVPTKDEKKFSHFDPFTDTNFDEVIQNLIWTSNGDFIYPPIADTNYKQKMAITFLDFMLLAFNTDQVKRYVAERSKGLSPSNDALFYRDPNINLSTYDLFDFPDIVFPYLCQGFLRTGKYGRNSTVVLDATDFGSHHHIDSLNLVYTKDGRELLHDLGYLWDHPNHSRTGHTNIHNTVYIDKQDQITTGRNGSFHLFITRSKVKAMQASSNAYSGIYNRTLVQIEHLNGKNYLVDIFRASGGKIREYVFHGVHHNYTIQPKLVFNQQYKFDSVSGLIRIALSKAGSFDITNAVLREKYSDESYGPNFVQPIPDSFGSLKCPNKGTWCNYQGNGEFDWKITKNGPNGENAIHFEATKPSPEGYFNVALNIGNCNGYKCPKGDAFIFNQTSRYELEFMMKGNVAPKIQLEYWMPGEELKHSGRRYITLSDFSGMDISSSWKKFKGTFVISDIAHILGAETNSEVKIKWNIDENYTFNSFIPARDKQMIFFEEGFGQRSFRDTDFGVTVPNFYVYRNEPNETSVFVNVFEGSFKGEEIVKDVSIKELENGNVIIEVDTVDGKDYILSSFDGKVIEGFDRKSDARLAVEISNDISSTLMIDGTIFKYSKDIITFNHSYSGDILGYYNEQNDSWYEIKKIDLKLDNLNQNIQCIYVTGDDGKNIERAYPIIKIEDSKDHMKVFTRVNSVGFRTHQTEKWRISSLIDSGDHVKDFTPVNSAEFHTYQADKSSKSLSTGAIVAIVIVIIVAVAAAIIGIVCFKKHQKLKRKTEFDRKLLLTSI